MPRGRRHYLPHERVEAMLNRSIPEPNSGCWIWMGEVKTSGYGECWATGWREDAHRSAYRLFVCDEIPAGKVVRHKCDTKLCINPDHLVLGTQADNIADKVRRNRQAKGVSHGSAKLTDDDVRMIRVRTDLSQRKLARILGVCQPVVGQIRRRERWTHVGD
jgi:DNA-binding XRE family transcriptional regulator